MSDTRNEIEIKDLTDLRDFIQRKLSQREHLEPGAFPTSERILLRNGRPCGIYFSLHGPRSVRLTAIWETEGNTVLFYGSNGERFAKTQLVQVPCLTAAAA